MSNVTGQNATTTSHKGQDEITDMDLTRAHDLVKLHYSVKVAHSAGSVDDGLKHARERVRRALNSMS